MSLAGSVVNVLPELDFTGQEHRPGREQGRADRFIGNRRSGQGSVEKVRAAARRSRHRGRPTRRPWVDIPQSKRRRVRSLVAPDLRGLGPARDVAHPSSWASSLVVATQRILGVAGMIMSRGVSTNEHEIPAIDVRGLTKSFGRFQALRGLDLVVRHGEVHGFLGPNGAGKSVTIRVLLGMYRPAGGRSAFSASTLIAGRRR